jgi:urease accessory protein
MRATDILPAGSFANPSDTVLLDYDRRHRRRIALTTTAGQEILLDLPTAVRLRHGDGLRLADGRIVAILSRPEKLLEIHAHDEAALVRIAWHLGNRHLPVQLLGERIRIRADHVIAEMVSLLGGHVDHIEAPFDPEPGAYAAGPTHHHPDDDDDDHHHHA